MAYEGQLRSKDEDDYSSPDVCQGVLRALAIPTRAKKGNRNSVTSDRIGKREGKALQMALRQSRSAWGCSG